MAVQYIVSVLKTRNSEKKIVVNKILMDFSLKNSQLLIRLFKDNRRVVISNFIPK